MAAKRLHLQSLEKESSMPSTDPENNILPEGKVTPSLLKKPKEKSGGCC